MSDLPSQEDCRKSPQLKSPPKVPSTLSRSSSSSQKQVFVWGYTPATAQFSKEPTKSNLLDGIQIAQVSCGENHMLILTERGLLYSTGSNQFGQLGTGLEPGPQKLQQVKLISSEVVKIACGQNTSYALTSDGLFAWGLNTD